MKRILLGQLASNGDCLHATIVAREIKRRSPDSHLTWAVAARCRPMIDGNPDVDAVMEVTAKTPAETESAWRTLADTTAQELRSGQWDEVVLSQVWPGNFARYDGTVRPSVLRSLPGAYGVPIENRLFVRDAERARADAFAETHRFASATHVILFECAALSGQSPVTPEWALEAARRMTAGRIDRIVVLSSAQRMPDVQWPIVDGSMLSIRETVALARHVTHLVGCSSGISCALVLGQAPRLPALQLLSSSAHTMASLVLDLEHFGRSAQHVVEMLDPSLEAMVSAATTMIEHGHAESRRRYHQPCVPDHVAWSQAIRHNLIKRGDLRGAAQSLQHVLTRFGPHPTLDAFFRQHLKPHFVRVPDAVPA